MSASRKAVIFDFIRTLYDPVTTTLYPGVRGMLEDLGSRQQLILYSRKDHSRSELLRSTGIEHHFKTAYFVEKKDAKSLKRILNENDLSPDRCIVVGDMVTSELAAANELGIDTVWFRQQSFAKVLDLSASFDPTHTVRTIEELD
ncbi:MAG: HAD family hydrolase, partial [Candidatus Paceibacterota bacterium]